jgi:hypothetical protein
MSKFRGTRRSEQDTLIRIGDIDELAQADTSSPRWARRWERRGYAVQVDGRVGGVPRRWKAYIPRRLIAFRRLSVQPPRPPAVFAAQLRDLGLGPGLARLTSRDERETTIQWYEDGATAQVCSTSPVHTKRMVVRYGFTLRVLHRAPNGVPWSWGAIVPRRCIRFRRERTQPSHPTNRLASGRFAPRTTVEGSVSAENSASATAASDAFHGRSRK